MNSIFLFCAGGFIFVTMFSLGLVFGDFFTGRKQEEAVEYVNDKSREQALYREQKHEDYNKRIKQMKKEVSSELIDVNPPEFDRVFDGDVEIITDEYEREMERKAHLKQS